MTRKRDKNAIKRENRRVSKKLDELEVKTKTLWDSVKDCEEKCESIRQGTVQVKQELSGITEDFNRVTEEFNRAREDVDRMREEVNRVERGVRNLIADLDHERACRFRPEERLLVGKLVYSWIRAFSGNTLRMR